MIKKNKTKLRESALREEVTSYLFLSPYLILFTTFIVIPVILALLLSFTNVDTVNFPKFIGLKNYITLLTTDKQLSPGNRAALEKAARAGVQIVPTTGRFFRAMPEVIRQLPFVRYVININGAAVADLQTGENLCRAEMPWQQVTEILEFLSGYDVLYDCWIDDQPVMESAMLDRVEGYTFPGVYRDMFRVFRLPVENLRSHVQQLGRDVQKISIVSRDDALRARLMEDLRQRFDGVIVTSSVPENIEINRADANKGQALLDLAARLGYSRENTMAFGDGLNDMTMIRAAGVGVAMENATPALKAAADWITCSNDQDGVARGIEKFCFTDL